MKKEYRVMMKKDGKWWAAHVNCRISPIKRTYEEAVTEMERVIKRRIEYGVPAEEYKIVSRNVTEWEDVKQE